MIIKTSFRRRNRGLDKQKLFTFVLICVSIDIDVPENQAELQRKGRDVYFITAEKGGNLQERIWVTTYRGHPRFIVLLAREITSS